MAGRRGRWGGGPGSPSPGHARVIPPDDLRKPSLLRPRIDPEEFFSGSRSFRWSLVPVLVAFAVVLVVELEGVSPVGVAVSLLLAGISLLYAAALAWPRRFLWARRMVALSVFLAYVAYLVVEWIVEDQPLAVPRRRSESSPGNALVGLIVIGLPALAYALRARRPADVCDDFEDDLLEDDEDDEDPGWVEPEGPGARVSGASR